MNILKIHENIISKIKTDPAKLEYLIDKYRTKYVDQENKLSRNIFLMKNNIPLHYYNLEVSDIIDDVKKQLNTVKISFVSTKRNDKYLCNLFDEYKDKISYLNIANFAPKKSFKCSQCDSSSDFEFLSNNSKVCTNCGGIENLIIYTIHHDDGDRIKLSTKNVPNRKAHFKDCLIKFLGIETLNDAKILQFNELMEKIRPEPSFKNIENITRESISQFLKQNKQFEKFNDNITLIYMKLTNKSFYMLSQEQINDIVNDFEILSKTYDDMINNKEINSDLLEDRTSFLNSQYIIYQLFRKHKIPCDKKDFILLKTVSKKMYHDTICEIVYKKLKWRFLPVF